MPSLSLSLSLSLSFVETPLFTLFREIRYTRACDFETLPFPSPLAWGQKRGRVSTGTYVCVSLPILFVHTHARLVFCVKTRTQPRTLDRSSHRRRGKKNTRYPTRVFLTPQRAQNPKEKKDSTRTLRARHRRLQSPQPVPRVRLGHPLRDHLRLHTQKTLGFSKKNSLCVLFSLSLSLSLFPVGPSSAAHTRAVLHTNAACACGLGVVTGGR